MKNLFFGEDFSVLSYCVSVWGGVTLCTSRCNRLNNLHKRIIKNLFDKYFPIGTCFFKVAKILKLGDIYRLRVGIYMHKISTMNSVPTFRNALNLYFPDHGYITRRSNTLAVTFLRVESIRINLNINLLKCGMMYLKILEHQDPWQFFRIVLNSISWTNLYCFNLIFKKLYLTVFYI